MKNGGGVGQSVGTVSEIQPEIEIENGNDNQNLIDQKLQGKNSAVVIVEEAQVNSLKFDGCLSVLKQLRSNSILSSYVYCGTLIAIWYILSTFLNLYNRNLMGHDRGAFPVPLMMSSFQFGLQYLMCRTVLDSGAIERTIESPISWREWSRTTLPNGISTGLDIGFSNKSYMFITVTFYTMCKSTTPMFLLFFAFIWGIEQPSWQIFKVVGCISLGLFLFVYGETGFNLVGFVLVMTAAALAGFRWMMTQLQLQGSVQKGGHASQGGPLEVMERLTPIMAITTLFISLVSEPQLWHLTDYTYFDSFVSLIFTSMLLIIGGSVAWCMVWAEFKVIQQTSSLTLIIAGTFKELFTVLAGVIIDGDTFTGINFIGLIFLILGVSLYNYDKYQKIKQGELKSINRSRTHQEELRDDEVELQPLNGNTVTQKNEHIRHAYKQQQLTNNNNNNNSNSNHNSISVPKKYYNLDI